MFKNIIVGLFAAGVLVSGMAYANHEACHRDGQKGMMFKEADTNGDGKVSYDEFKAMHEKRGEEMFKRMDTNGDGFVDEAEKKAMHDKMHDKMQGMGKDHCEKKSDHK